MNTPKKILIVDDESINLDFFDVMLTKLGFIAERAEDGIEALEKIKRFLPDLILLDNVMPRMSGWELTKMLKSDPKHKEIPIIMLSALDDVKDKIEGFELGIEDYITKPYNFSEVLARIRAALRNRDLYEQVSAYEIRLSQAQELFSGMKQILVDFGESLDGFEIALTGSKEQDDSPNLGKHLKELGEKSKKVRGFTADLDSRLEKVLSGWEQISNSETESHPSKAHNQKITTRE